MCDGFSFPPYFTFLLSPPRIPDGRISRVRLAAVAAFPKEPSHTKRSLSTRLHTPLYSMVITLARHAKKKVHCDPVLSPDSVDSAMSTTHREPLCLGAALPASKDDDKASSHPELPEFGAPACGSATTGSCVRPNSSWRLWLSLVRQVFAGCYEPLLEDGPRATLSLRSV